MKTYISTYTKIFACEISKQSPIIYSWRKKEREWE